MSAAWQVVREHPHFLQTDGTRHSSSGGKHQQSSSTGGELHRLVNARCSSRVTERAPSNPSVRAEKGSHHYVAERGLARRTQCTPGPFCTFLEHVCALPDERWSATGQQLVRVPQRNRHVCVLVLCGELGKTAAMALLFGAELVETRASFASPVVRA
jgi:hypothetical protein